MLKSSRKVPVGSFYRARLEENVVMASRDYPIEQARYLGTLRNRLRTFPNVDLDGGKEPTM